MWIVSLLRWQPSYWEGKFKMYRFTLSYAILSLSLLQSAWAGGGESTVLDHTINTVVLLVLVSYFAGKKIKDALQERADSIGHEIQEAKRVYAEAEEVLKRIDHLNGVE